MGAPVIRHNVSGSQTVKDATWTFTQADPTGAAVGPDLADWADRTLQVIGTFGAGTITLQGSNDGTNWQTLNTPGGVAITGIAAFLRQVLESPTYMRVVVTGADGTTALTAILSMKRPTLGRF